MTHSPSTPNRLVCMCLVIGATTLGVGSVWSQKMAPEVSTLYTMVGNGGFEEGGQLPTFWAPFPSPPETWGSQKRDLTVFHTGAASGMLLSEAPHPTGKAAVQWNKYGLAVEGGSALIFSGWVKVSKTRPVGAGCHFYDKDRGHLGFVPIPVPGLAQDWTCLRQTVPVPAQAVNMGVALYGGDEGTTWWDDVALLGTPTTALVGGGAPAVDGQIEEAFWGSRPPLQGFAVEPGTALVRPQPEVRLAYDNGNVYAAARCPAAAVYQFELLLDPRHEHRDFMRVAVGADGSLVSTRSNGRQWIGGAGARVRTEGDTWTAELALPLDLLALDLTVGNTWGMNVVLRSAQRGEIWTWSLGGVDDPARLGNATLTPDLTYYYLRDLTLRVEPLASKIAAARQEILAAAVPPEGQRAALALLDAASERLGAMQRTYSLVGAPRASAQDLAFHKAMMAAYSAHRPVARDQLLAQLAEIETAIRAAREQAAQSAFRPGLRGGFRVVPASSLCKVPKTEPVPAELPPSSVRLEAAQDESESFQLVIVPAEGDLKGVQVSSEGLQGPGGVIPLLWRRVGYVETAPPGYKADYVGWWPDPLLPPAAFDVPAKERQPLWFTVTVPPEAEPGLYSGAVSVAAETTRVTVPVELKVRTFRLPRPGTLATAFGLYASTLAKWWWGKEPYRDKMPPEMFAQWCEFLGKYRLGVKNAAAEYITQTDEGATLKVDLAAAERLLQGVGERYFPPWSVSLCRLPSAVSVGKTPALGDPATSARFVLGHKEDWERRGLPKEVHIYGFDEPSPAQYPILRTAYERVRQVAPGYPIMQTLGDPNPQQLAGVVDIWCPLTPALTSRFYQERLAAGDTLWAYTCCSPKPPFANLLIDEPAVDHRVLLWQLRQAGATGFLYWCVCWWDGLPNAASGKPCFPDVPIQMKDHSTYLSYKDNGDGMLVYPGRDREPWPSIRLEVLRDGIEDYEYLALLGRLVAAAKRMPPELRPSAETLEQAEELCKVPPEISRSMTDYTKDTALLLARRRQVAEKIEELTARAERR